MLIPEILGAHQAPAMGFEQLSTIVAYSSYGLPHIIRTDNSAKDLYCSNQYTCINIHYCLIFQLSRTDNFGG
jgi:hypothetical protein